MIALALITILRPAARITPAARLIAWLARSWVTTYGACGYQRATRTMTIDSRWLFRHCALWNQHSRAHVLIPGRKERP